MNYFFRLPSGSATLAIGYITTGILMVVWTVVWLIYMLSNHQEAQGPYYICFGLMSSGVAILVIGILTGRIGQEAKNADGVTPVPGSPDVVPTVAQPVAANQGMPQAVAPQQITPQQVAPVAAAPVQQAPSPAQSHQVVGR